MASRRMIASDIWRDDFICSLTLLERVLWIGLIVTCADDQGRLLNRPRFIQADIFPNDNNISLDDVQDALLKIEYAGKTYSYEEDGKCLLQIVNWWDYQTPTWATPSKYPAPPDWIDRIKVHITGNAVRQENWDKPGGFLHIPQCNPLHIPIEDVKSKVREEEECAPAPASSPFRMNFQPNYVRIWSAVTGMIAIPNDEVDRVTEAINGFSLRYMQEDDLIAFLQPFYDAWKVRKTKNGRMYSKTNAGWIDWAIAGEIPDAGKPPGVGGKQYAEVYE